MVKRTYLLRSWININDKFTVHKTTSQRCHGVLVMGKVYSRNFPIGIMSVDLFFFELSKKRSGRRQKLTNCKTHDICILLVVL